MLFSYTLYTTTYLPLLHASSVKGDLFEGAVGSTLYIDEVELSYMH